MILHTLSLFGHGKEGRGRIRGRMSSGPREEEEEEGDGRRRGPFPCMHPLLPSFVVVVGALRIHDDGCFHSGSSSNTLAHLFVLPYREGDGICSSGTLSARAHIALSP